MVDWIQLGSNLDAESESKILIRSEKSLRNTRLFGQRKSNARRAAGRDFRSKIHQQLKGQRRICGTFIFRFGFDVLGSVPFWIRSAISDFFA
ncbi:hypothetical protein L596_019279 [Steinernema carpocapsae]|uniref:Uncharacterized protein n=1 Tax=Steinernema carpocapsae TaxID=34508 RepID=A0A4U5MQ10_STECR|nr:hypothetical protein L596_019279 [Steinernema carpocapsae]